MSALPLERDTNLYPFERGLLAMFGGGMNTQEIAAHFVMCDGGQPMTEAYAYNALARAQELRYRGTIT